MYESLKSRVKTCIHPTGILYIFLSFITIQCDLYPPLYQVWYANRVCVYIYIYIYIYVDYRYKYFNTNQLKRYIQCSMMAHHEQISLLSTKCINLAYSIALNISGLTLVDSKQNQPTSCINVPQQILICIRPRYGPWSKPLAPDCSVAGFWINIWPGFRRLTSFFSLITSERTGAIWPDDRCAQKFLFFH